VPHDKCGVGKDGEIPPGEKCCRETKVVTREKESNNDQKRDETEGEGEKRNREPYRGMSDCKHSATTLVFQQEGGC